jgi:hypothetical protein
MPELKNLRHERFCQLFVALGVASEAYRQAGFKSKTVDGNAGRLIVRDSICKRVAEIRAENQRKFKLTLEGAVELLTEIATTPAGEVTRHSRLCQSFKHTSGDGWECDEIKMPDKLAAIQELSRIGGWHSAQRLELSAGSPLTKYLSDLRSEREVKAIEIEAETEKDVSK